MGLCFVSVRSTISSIAIISFVFARGHLFLILYPRGNPLTAKNMSEHIDVDVSKILSRQINLDQAGDALIEATVKTANGKITCAEALGHKEHYEE